MAIQNAFPKDEKQVVDSALSTTSTNPVQNKIITSNINSINSTLSSKANTSDVLTKTNTTAFTPTADYHPATKAYVDSKAGGSDKRLILNIPGEQRIDGDTPLTIITNADTTKDYEVEFDVRIEENATYCRDCTIYFEGSYSNLKAYNKKITFPSDSYGTPEIFSEDIVEYNDYIRPCVSNTKKANNYRIKFNLIGKGSFQILDYKTKYKGYSIDGKVQNLFEGVWIGGSDPSTTEFSGCIYNSKDASYSGEVNFIINKVELQVVDSSYYSYYTFVSNLKVYEIAKN